MTETWCYEHFLCLIASSRWRNIRKAAGPDGITGRILRLCADQLAGLFTSIFNESLATSVIPTSFKKSVIIPVPKNSKPSCLNDYRPVALTSTVMKVFERLLKKHICSSIPATLDPLQFAYRPNRSTDDAISQVLHSSLTHIDSKNGNYVRLLFIDYSSAFDTIVPSKLAVKLSDLGLNTTLCDWIQDSLVQTYAPSRSLRSASERRLVVPSQRGTKSLSRTFSWTVPSWWNDLPISIRTAESLAIFKKHLKTHLFRQHLTN